MSKQSCVKLIVYKKHRTHKHVVDPKTVVYNPNLTLYLVMLSFSQHCKHEKRNCPTAATVGVFDDRVG